MTRVIAHLTSSGFFGGPERQMLGLASALPDRFRSVFLLFDDRGACRPFVDQIEREGFAVEVLSPAGGLRGSVRALSDLLRRVGASVLCGHGYKADLLGLAASRRVGVPLVAVSRGYTAASRRVKMYESADRLALRFMHRVVCVSEGQAEKIRRAGVALDRVVVIRNAIRADRFDAPDPSYEGLLRGLFPEPPARVVGAAGRLSPEKGFGVLVEAAGEVVRADPDAGFVLFGEGPLRDDLERQVAAQGLQGRFILAGFRADLDRFLPHLDLAVLPSYTEGLPNVALEALAAGVPVVATAVGGTPEVVEDGVCGYLVPPGDPTALARRIVDGLRSGPGLALGARGRERVRDLFTFEAQAAAYARLFDELAGRPLATAAPVT